MPELPGKQPGRAVKHHSPESLDAGLHSCRCRPAPRVQDARNGVPVTCSCVTACIPYRAQFRPKHSDLDTRRASSSIDFAPEKKGTGRRPPARSGTVLPPHAAEKGGRFWRRMSGRTDSPATARQARRAVLRALWLKVRCLRRRARLGGGEGGIRTHGTREGTTVFETVPIDHSGTSPQRTRPTFAREPIDVDAGL